VLGHFPKSPFRPLELACVFAATSWKMPRDLIRTGEDLNMWLFTARYAHLGAAICLITFVVASIGVVFITTGVRLIQRRDLKVLNCRQRSPRGNTSFPFGRCGRIRRTSFRLRQTQSRRGAVSRRRWHLTRLDWYDPVEQVSSVARSAFVRLFSDALWRSDGLGFPLCGPQQIHVTRRLCLSWHLGIDVGFSRLAPANRTVVT
jgi:hypothetical protein